MSSLQTVFLLCLTEKNHRVNFLVLGTCFVLVNITNSTSLCIVKRNVVIFANKMNTTAMSDRKESQMTIFYFLIHA